MRIIRKKRFILHGENNDRSYSDANVDDVSRDSVDSMLLEVDNNDVLFDFLDINVGPVVRCNDGHHDVQAVAIWPLSAMMHEDNATTMLLCIKNFIFN